MAYNQTKPILPIRQKDIDRFWSHVYVRGPDECWPWLKSKDRRGYGRFQMRGSTFKPHRVAHCLTHGEPAMELLVLHSCDNPPCCNPRHLRAGTALDNTTDKRERGRGCTGDRHWTRQHPELVKCPQDHPFRKRELRQGELHPLAKLSGIDVLEIREIIAAKKSTRADLASRFGVSVGTISHIVTKHTWTHI